MYEYFYADECDRTLCSCDCEAYDHLDHFEQRDCVLNSSKQVQPCTLTHDI